MTVSPDQVRALVPAWAAVADLHIELLPGGLTNQNVRVQIDEELFVLRLSSQATSQRLGIRRESEAQAAALAAKHGLAPEVVYASPSAGTLVTRFVSGREWTWEEIRRPEIIEQIGQLLKKVHDLPAIATAVSPFSLAEHYRSVLETEAHAPWPENWSWLCAQMQHVEQELQQLAAEPVLCHNDPCRRNFVTNGKLWLLDWEYAGMGDGFYDLAVVALNHRYSAEQEEALLQAYNGGITAADRRHLHLTKQTFAFREALWALVQAENTSIDFDYRRYAGALFRWLTQSFEAV